MIEDEGSAWYPVLFFKKENLNGRTYTHDSFTPEALKRSFHLMLLLLKMIHSKTYRIFIIASNHYQILVK